MKKKVLVVVIAALCLALLGACGGAAPEEAIIGTWECRDATVPHVWLCLLTFDESGRFVDRDGDGGSFSIDGNSLTLQFDEAMFGTHTVNFNISGNRLTLTEDGLRIVLNRQ